MKKINSTNITTKYSQSKPYYKQDLILYALVIVFVVLLFLFFIVIPKTSKPKGFSVSLDNQTFFTFDFANEEVTIINSISKIVHDKNGNTIKIYTLDGEGFNVLTYDTENYSVYISDANCSNLDCIDFFEITSGNGVIYCLPHGLKITPLTPSESQPSTGGRL